MMDFWNYEIAQIVWWNLVGVLFIGFMITGGFDIGVAILMPFIGRNDIQRRVLLNTIGPTWEGNQVWLLLGAGAIFAAWPIVYAVLLSVMYSAVIVLLLALILRPVGFDFRSKIDTVIWRNMWDACIFLSGFLIAFLFGVAIGNLMIGVDFAFDSFMKINSNGTFFSLLSPFTLLCGCLSVSMLIMHASAFIVLRTSDIIVDRAKKLLSVMPFIILGLMLTIYLMLGYIDGYSVVYKNDMTNDAVLLRHIVKYKGAWLANNRHWIAMIAPITFIISTVLVFIFHKIKKYALVFISSSVMLAFALITIGYIMFPFIVPSSANPLDSLMLYNASSSFMTLNTMLVVVIIVMPIVLSYTSYIYYVMRGKISEGDILQNSKSLY